MIEEQTNKSNKIIMILLVLVILGGLVYLGYKYEIIPNFFDKVIKEKNKKEEEIAITDNNLIEDLSSKVSSLSTSYRPGKFVIEDLYEGNKVTELTSDEKKIIAMRKTPSEQLNISEEIKNAVNTVTRYTGINGNVSVTCSSKEDKSCRPLTFKNKNTYLDNYQKLFNEKIDMGEKESDWDVRENCAVYYYVTELGKFLYNNNCNTIKSSGKNLLYKEKYTTLKDKAYVYVRVGLITKESSTYTIYGDTNQKRVVEEKVTEEKKNSYNIDQSNFTLFDCYKFTFKKDNITNNYYFESVEKTK